MELKNLLNFSIYTLHWHMALNFYLNSTDLISLSANLFLLFM
ncbi:hypothetical protein T08_481 [Trichinella sp. T8]|nr:hypothetical protein T08_481 [Trichinella sp. T8]